MAIQQALATCSSGKELRRHYDYLRIDLLVDTEAGSEQEVDRQLIESIHRYGLIQPLIVIPGNRQYQVVSGQKQLAACRILQGQRRLPEGNSLPCIIIDADTVDELLLAQNFQQRELDVLHEAELMESVRARLEYASEKELAEHLNLPEGYVRATLKLLALPEEIKAEWKREASRLLKKNQLLEVARKKPEEQMRVWNTALEKARREADGKKKAIIIPDKDSSKEPPAQGANSAITFKPRPETIPFANASNNEGKPAQTVAASQASPPSASPKKQPDEGGQQVDVTVHDFQEMTAKRVAPLVKLPGTEKPKAEGPDDGSSLQLDLEAELPDFSFAVTAMLHDLSQFNPARYNVKDKDGLVAALEGFITELVETAQVARDIKAKLIMGPEAAARQLAELKRKAGIQAAEKRADLSRNSFNEVIEQIIQNLPAEELQRLEQGFHLELKLNPTLKKRNPERYGQILHGLLIDHFMEQAAAQPRQ